MLASLALAIPVGAQDELGFQTYLPQLRARAEQAGIRRATLDAVFPTVSFVPRAIDLDRRQPESSPTAPIPMFAPYRASHVDTARISAGRSAYLTHAGALARIERQTGVPGPIVLAIWGHETNYGQLKGGFDVLSSLATLAYEGRRRDLFSDEFIAALRIVERGYPREMLTGSWAGAMGNPQFLPSVYLRLARDGDGDGRADIWNSPGDSLASIAAYLADAGWRPGQPWGFGVTVPATLDRTAIANRSNVPRCPRVFQRHSGWRTVAEWKRLGLWPSSGYWKAGDATMATLIEPDGPNGTGFLLTGNYRAILDYNCSNFYALSVGLLADAIAQ